MCATFVFRRVPLCCVITMTNDGNFEPSLAPTRYKYTYMEEMLGNVAGCRQVFERWTEWEPELQAWHSYINFELRYKEVEKARTIYERYILFMKHK